MNNKVNQKQESLAKEQEFLQIIATIIKDEVIGTFNLTNEGLFVKLANGEEYLISVTKQ